MKIGIFQDLHANLPALKRAISFFKEKRCTHIIHVGDFIGIGPYPRECMELGLSIAEMEFIMGNHDYWYAYGLPSPTPHWMDQLEVKQKGWTHQQLGNTFKSIVQQWPFTITKEPIPNKKVVFQHYGLDDTKRWFPPILKNPTAPDLDQLFTGINAEVIFYGHQHKASDISGKGRYINLGSAGCYDRPEVRVATLEMINNQMIIEKNTLFYDDNGLMEAIVERKLPAAAFIKKVFIIRK